MRGGNVLAKGPGIVVGGTQELGSYGFDCSEKIFLIDCIGCEVLSMEIRMEVGLLDGGASSQPML